jgi:glycogen(starch) synthase
MVKTKRNPKSLVLEPASRKVEVPDPIFGDRSAALDLIRKPILPLTEVPPTEKTPQEPPKPILAIFCFEDADSIVGQFVSRLAPALAQGNLAVHLFARKDFELEGVTLHLVGDSQQEDLYDQVQDFARRAGNSFLGTLPVGSVPITLLGCEWSAIPVLTILQCIKNLNILWSLHSLERQRSDLSSALSKSIEEIELAGLRAAKHIIVHDPSTAQAAKDWVPECAGRIVNERQVFPVAHFSRTLDAGRIKERYQVGPVDPTILFVGDLSEAYGPDLLVKAMPAILKNHPQARLILVGEGTMYWPLRVYTRYLLLEHAVRLVGSVQGPALCELVQAADIIAVPSRQSTPWWPFLAAWAARRPVVATHDASVAILENEQDSILCYPSENSCVWGIERFLYDAELGKRLADKGHDKLQERFGWKNIAEQVASLLGTATPLPC